jgi:cellulose synthase/poly-beta-1,6-N-acetylglucosamine synthase-like glycosyltransferase
VITYAFFSLLTALTAVYLLFLFRIRAGLRYLLHEPAEQLPDIDDPKLPFVTVLVPARNEEARIARTLASLRAQRFPADRVEFIMLDDHSEDATARIATAIAAEDARITILPSSGSGKKAAITTGVAMARGEIIVTTDADCEHHEDWLRAMVHPFMHGADIVAGPVVYTDRRGFLRRLQAMEFLGLVGVGAGFFGIGYPRLCNGANLAYRRAEFTAVSGFAGNSGIASGDDEFLLHAIVYQRGGTARFVTAPASVVRTDPAPTVREFLRQRVRWASKGREYSDGRFVSFLVLLFVYFLFIAAAPFVSITSPAALGAGMVLLLLKVIADASVLYAAAAMFRQPFRPLDLIAAELLHAYYLVVVSLTGFFGRYTWKNRMLSNSGR